MEKPKKLALLVGLLIVYFLIVNLISPLIHEGIESKNFTRSGQSGSNLVVGMGDSISFKVTRTRVYGRIEIIGKDKVLYLFNVLKIPLLVNGFKIWIVHLILIGILGFLYWGLDEDENEMFINNEPMESI